MGSCVVLRECLYIRYNLFAGTETPSLSLYKPIALNILFGGLSPNLVGRVELGGSGVVPRESPPYLCIICLLEPKRYMSPLLYDPIAIHILVGGTVPQIWGKGVKLGGRARYPVKAHHTGYNLLIETDTLSLFV